MVGWVDCGVERDNKGEWGRVRERERQKGRWREERRKWEKDKERRDKGGRQGQGRTIPMIYDALKNMVLFFRGRIYFLCLSLAFYLMTLPPFIQLVSCFYAPAIWEMSGLKEISHSTQPTSGERMVNLVDKTF